jgi:hypothetical protein
MPSYRKSSIGDRGNISLDHVLDLISITTTRDNLGQFTKVENPYMVFCAKQSIVRSEFNQAGQLGLKPDSMFLIDADSYGDEKLLDFENKRYSIYKTFQRSDGFIELYCEVKSGD